MQRSEEQALKIQAKRCHCGPESYWRLRFSLLLSTRLHICSGPVSDLVHTYLNVYIYIYIHLDMWKNNIAIRPEEHI